MSKGQIQNVKNKTKHRTVGPVAVWYQGNFQVTVAETQEVGPKLLETTQETFSEHFTMSVKKRNRWEV